MTITLESITMSGISRAEYKRLGAMCAFLLPLMILLTLLCGCGRQGEHPRLPSGNSSTYQCHRWWRDVCRCSNWQDQHQSTRLYRYRDHPRRRCYRCCGWTGSSTRVLLCVAPGMNPGATHSSSNCGVAQPCGRHCEITQQQRQRDTSDGHDITQPSLPLTSDHPTSQQTCRKGTRPAHYDDHAACRSKLRADNCHNPRQPDDEWACNQQCFRKSPVFLPRRQRFTLRHTSSTKKADTPTNRSVSYYYKIFLYLCLFKHGFNTANAGA